ncbi:neurogenic locus notch homolog protein 1-like isoform X5 [Dreissena polymorpha]|uniref:neurogenic locus notch homolog protein 1-like isoform X5 n=1 Tax=Dreissena polymorpha TaxID=45954 RepID=UPI0022643CC7|nr:neurogenic locus notch homolog protein 1-like isoform X5 [Dreissena polymorpha]
MESSYAYRRSNSYDCSVETVNIEDNTASQGIPEQRRQKRRFCQQANCKYVTCRELLVIAFGLGVIVVLVLCAIVGHYKNNGSQKERDKSADAQPTLALVADNSTLIGPDTPEYIKYSIDVKGSLCKGVNCRQCKLTINASVGALKHSEGNHCQLYKYHTGYRDCAANSSLGCIGQCMDCNGTCRNYSSMVQYLGKQSPCTEDIDTIKCCTLLHMLPDDHCRNGGKLFCEGGEGDTYAPKCTCPVGWTGKTCETRMNETCTCISSVVNVTLLIVLCVQNTLASTDGHSEITQRDSTGDIKYCIDVKGSPCKGFDCRQCKLTINATVGALQRSEGPDCSRTKGHKGYRNCADNPSWDCIGQCMDCYGNGTCLDYNSMTQHLGNQSPCTTEAEKIMCCTLLHMLPDDHCRNGGKLFCEGDTYATNCTCPVGWTGETCETRMNETVTCKCFKTDIPWTSFCGENDMYNCTDDGRPENWTECRQTIEGVTFSRCACEKSEGDTFVPVTPGEKATLTCRYGSNSTWYHDRKLVVSDNTRRVNRDGTLEVLKATIDDDEMYECHVARATGLQIYRFLLQVQVPIGILPGRDTIMAKPSSKAFLHCEVYGNPKPSVSWTKNGSPLRSSSRYETFSNGTLLIQSVTPGDADSYTCRADNGVSTPVDRTIKLLLRVMLVARIENRNGRVMEGGRIRLSCEGKGYPKPAITWEKAGRALVSGGNVLIRGNGGLKIRDATSSDTGTYTCIVSNTDVKIEASTSVQVVPKNVMTRTV